MGSAPGALMIWKTYFFSFLPYSCISGKAFWVGWDSLIFLSGGAAHLIFCE
jgi:hypothetical protein